MYKFSVKRTHFTQCPIIGADLEGPCVKCIHKRDVLVVDGGLGHRLVSVKKRHVVILVLKLHLEKTFLIIVIAGREVGHPMLTFSTRADLANETRRLQVPLHIVGYFKAVPSAAPWTSEGTAEILGIMQGYLGHIFDGKEIIIIVDLVLSQCRKSEAAKHGN